MHFQVPVNAKKKGLISFMRQGQTAGAYGNDPTVEDQG